MSAWKGLVRMICFSKNEDRAELFTQWMDFRKKFSDFLNFQNIFSSNKKLVKTHLGIHSSSESTGIQSKEVSKLSLLSDCLSLLSIFDLHMNFWNFSSKRHFFSFIFCQRRRKKILFGVTRQKQLFLLQFLSKKCVYVKHNRTCQA